MNSINLVIVVIFLWLEVKANISDEHILEHVKTNSSEMVQTQAAFDVIRRLIPEKAELFDVSVNFSISLNSFQIQKISKSDSVHIIASSGVAACKAFHYYLKHYCGCHISWDGDQLNLPDELPIVDIQIQAPSRIVYYQNVCTWSYSFTWWTWKEWRRHIDWIAMSGITLTLAPFQEDIWTEVYLEYNLDKSEIEDHFAGPGFFAWQRMGNIRGWGGPLTNSFISHSTALQTKIIEALRMLGIVVALPAFAGHLPIRFKTLFPNSTLTPVDRWNKFPDQYASPLFLDPTDSLFVEIAGKFLQKVIDKYGTDHIYFSDPFNEVQPRLSSAKYLASASSGIYHAMVEVDPNAVWLLQGWMFVKNPFWSDRAVQAFLTAVPTGRMLVLDLQSDQYPQYDRTKSYHGQPFIWCMLHNFGGTMGMHGSADIVFNRIREIRSSGNYTMLGTGITPEGINQNYVMYEFALEMGWSTDISSVEEWFKYYSNVRYGKKSELAENAWINLLKSVYSFHGLEKLGGKYTFNRRPSLRIYPWTWYNHTMLVNAWKNMLNISTEFRSNNLFQHDLVDITRQFLQNIADKIYISVITAYTSRSLEDVKILSSQFLYLLEDIDRILNTSPDFLLGKWLESAKYLGKTDLEKEKYEYNARNQITLWGPQGQISDYANKQWAGIVSDYFYPRWEMFFSEMILALQINKTLNENETKEKIFRLVENPFNTDNHVYPVLPDGDSVDIAYLIYQRWGLLENLPDVPFGQDVWKSGSKRSRKLKMKNKN